MTENAQVQDKPAERGIHITNFLLAALIFLGGVLGTSITTKMEDLNDGVKEVTVALNRVQLSVGQASVKLTNLKEDVEDLEDRVTVLENRHLK